LKDWLRFIGAKGGSEMAESAERNESIKKAVEVVETLSADYRMRVLADERELAIMDEMVRNEPAASIMSRGLAKGVDFSAGLYCTGVHVVLDEHSIRSPCAMVHT
jgi:hypothetical protein